MFKKRGKKKVQDYEGKEPDPKDPDNEEEDDKDKEKDSSLNLISPEDQAAYDELKEAMHAILQKLTPRLEMILSQVTPGLRARLQGAYASVMELQPYSAMPRDVLSNISPLIGPPGSGGELPPSEDNPSPDLAPQFTTPYAPLSSTVATVGAS